MTETTTPTTPALLADFTAARAAIPAASSKAATLISGIWHPDEQSTLPPWTVGDVAAHLYNVCLAYAASAADDFGDLLSVIPDRRDLKARLATVNDRMIDLVTPAARAKIPTALTELAEAIVAATTDRNPDDVCQTPWFGEGDQLPLSAVTGLFLSETVLHSFDIARATNQPLHIDPEHARLILSLVFPPMMPKTVATEVARDLTAHIRFRVRGGVTIDVVANRGTVVATRNPAPDSDDHKPDCCILVDPVAFLLAASGRTTWSHQIARGRVLPYGRKPWLALKATRLFWFP